MPRLLLHLVEQHGVDRVIAHRQRLPLGVVDHQVAIDLGDLLGHQTEALLAGLRLSQTPGIRQRCRAHAESFSGSTLGFEFEELYASVQ